MPTTRSDDPAELLRLVLIGLDAQIADLQETRAQLAALIDQPIRRPSRGNSSATKAAQALGRGKGENRRCRKGALGQREKSESKESKSPKAENSGQEGAVKGQAREDPASSC